MRANAMNNMAGQLFVSQVELPRRVAKMAIGPSGEPLPPTFIDLPFQQAIDHFLARGLLTPEQFAVLMDAERFRAFAATRAMSDAVAESMRQQIARAFTEQGGAGLREFVRRFRSQVDAGDLPGGGRGYAQNVFRTATATSYNAGRRRAQQDAGVSYVEYLTAHDERVRSEHRALHGRMFRSDDPELAKVYPPNGYQCRCVVVAVHPDDVDESRMGLGGVRADDVVDRGFSGPPDAAIEDEADSV